jgi:hypothetical protein
MSNTEQYSKFIERRNAVREQVRRNAARKQVLRRQAQQQQVKQTQVFHVIAALAR